MVYLASSIEADSIRKIFTLVNRYGRFTAGRIGYLLDGTAKDSENVRLAGGENGRKDAGNGVAWSGKFSL
ncbi:hypothetical protein P22_0996 [Propionispora sp. 2/2-37]|nr:hypothetical protein P22_0996 [Propionispora sp. 2/2-37]